MLAYRYGKQVAKETPIRKTKTATSTLFFVCLCVCACVYVSLVVTFASYHIIRFEFRRPLLNTLQSPQ
jgi:hypothetical protein